MFKATFVCALVLLFCGTALATDSPIDKGSFYLDGTAYFQSQSGDLFEVGGDAVTSYGFGNGSLNIALSYELLPTVGYFVSPGVFVGGQFSFIGYSIGNTDATLFAIGPTIGYYFNANSARTEVKGTLYPYIRGFVNFGSLSEDLFGEQINVWQYGGKGGFLYMMSGAVALDGSVRFQGDSWKSDSATESITGTTIAVGFGVSAFIY